MDFGYPEGSHAALGRFPAGDGSAPSRSIPAMRVAYVSAYWSPDPLQSPLARYWPDLPNGSRIGLAGSRSTSLPRRRGICCTGSNAVLGPPYESPTYTANLMPALHLTLAA
jgi:hypothetical protein